MKDQVKGTQRKTVTLRIRIRKARRLNNILGEKVSGEKDVDGNRRVYQQDPGQERLTWESGVEENVQGEEQDLEDKILFVELRWMSRAHKTDLEEETCSVTDSSVGDNSRNSGIDTYSDGNSSTRSELTEIAIHTFLVETRAKDLDREV